MGVTNKYDKGIYYDLNPEAVQEDVYIYAKKVSLRENAEKSTNFEKI